MDCTHQPQKIKRFLYMPNYSHIMCESIRKHKMKMFLLKNGFHVTDANKIAGINQTT